MEVGETRDKLETKEIEDFIEKHHVVYVRHNMDTTVSVYQELISNGLIAVHYGERLKRDVDSKNLKNHENPENYEDKYARYVLNRLSYYCETGAIVFADYSESLSKSIKKAVNIGVIPEGKQYEAKRYYGHEKYPEGFVYKQVELSNYITLGYADFAPFLAIHPRGGTVIHWDAEKPVKFIYKRELGLPIDTKSLDVEVLFPAQQEVLCSEYLRTKASNEIRLKHLLLPVGRGMKTVDIDGVSETKRLFAQVSFTKNENKIKGKIADLEDLAEGYHGSKELVLVYFGAIGSEKYVHHFAPDIRFVSLDEVFKAMKETGILSDMLQLKLAL